jgi:hypothetical protein
LTERILQEVEQIEVSMANAIHDRVLLFKNKFEEHLLEEFFILPMHYRQISQLEHIPLEKIAERLDYMMTRHEFFRGNVNACTINAFVKNFNNLQQTDKRERLEQQKKIDEMYFVCPDCKQKVKRTNIDSHKYNCVKLVAQKT